VGFLSLSSCSANGQALRVGRAPEPFTSVKRRLIFSTKTMVSGSVGSRASSIDQARGSSFWQPSAGSRTLAHQASPSGETCSCLDIFMLNVENSVMEKILRVAGQHHESLMRSNAGSGRSLLGRRSPICCGSGALLSPALPEIWALISVSQSAAYRRLSSSCRVRCSQLTRAGMSAKQS